MIRLSLIKPFSLRLKFTLSLTPFWVYFLALVMTFLFNKRLISSLANTSLKVKLIYIDPPYNTGNDSFNYNDNFNHATWLTFMKNRLEIARDLLSEDGVIFVQCDDNEQAYLKVLMDEIFGRDNFINIISAKMKNIAGASGGG
jgi:adenine specific DNA methylase Mod